MTCFVGKKILLVKIIEVTNHVTYKCGFLKILNQRFKTTVPSLVLLTQFAVSFHLHPSLIHSLLLLLLTATIPSPKSILL